MKYRCCQFIFAVLLFAITFQGKTEENVTLSNQTLNKISENINFDWKFIRLNLESKQHNDSFRDSIDLPPQQQWRDVQLPHDWSIEDLPNGNSPFSPDSEDLYDTGYTVGGVGWYKKTFTLPKASKRKAAILLFDGVYMDAKVFVNGQLAIEQYYGYTAFWSDIGKFLNWGTENEILVKVTNAHKNSRWYSGSGIYRTVSLDFKPQTHLTTWGTSVTTPKVSAQRAEIKVKTLLKTQQAAQKPTQQNTPLHLTQRIYAPNQQLVAEITKELKPNTSQDEQSFLLTTPELWGTTTPALYRLHQVLSRAGNTLDENITTFGIRSISADANNGFLLNGQPVLLKGMNIHHDHYMLGAAAYADAEERRVKLILDAGYNAIRASHNPPSSAFLDAADKHGLLVINEVFDSWNRKKWDHDNDYSKRFKQDWQKDLTNFVLRDRNHPSIIMWSLGNEIPEQGEPIGTDTAKMLADYTRQLDPTRPTTVGANMSGEFADSYVNQFDIVGYNYQEFNYESDHKREPKRVMYGSETYANKAFEYWQYVEKHPYIIGDFVWTGWDYLGEASIGWTGYKEGWKGIGEYPWHLAYCGEIDALGFKRPTAYYRDVLWNTGQNKLSMFVKSPFPTFTSEQPSTNYLYWVQEDLHPSWQWPGYEQQPLEVTVFSRYPKVALMLNGKIIGTKKVSVETEYMTTFTVPYQAGELSVIGYIGDKAQETRSLYSTSSPSRIELSANVDKIDADGQSLVFITAKLFDQNNRPIYHRADDLRLNFNVTGPGQLIGIGNADPMSVESFQSNTRTTFNGRLIAVVRGDRNTEGAISITASVDVKESKDYSITPTSVVVSLSKE